MAQLEMQYANFKKMSIFPSMTRVEIHKDSNPILKPLGQANSSKALPSTHHPSLAKQGEQKVSLPEFNLSSNMSQKRFAGLASNSVHKQPIDSMRA